MTGRATPSDETLDEAFYTPSSDKNGINGYASLELYSSGNILHEIFIILYGDS
jgi:hypothetical protein